MSRSIVLVLPNPPLPFGNAAARWFWVAVRGLVARGHRVTTLAICRTDAERREVRERFPEDRYDIRLFGEPPPRRGPGSRWQTARRPFSYMFGADLRTALTARLAEGFDILHLEQLWTGWIGERWARRALLHVHYLPSIDGGPEPRGWRDRLRAVAAARAERRLLRHYPHVSALTPELGNAIHGLVPARRPAIVPLALDHTAYPFDPAAVPPPPVVTLIGSFDWHPTRAAAERLGSRLWPAIRARVPGARLQLVGRSADTMCTGPAFADAEVVADVDDIVPWFARARVMVYAPPRASGMKVKVMEAFALGLPVVTTPDGVEGLPAKDGREAGIATDDAGLVERAVGILTQDDTWAGTRTSAHTLVRTHCDPDRCLDRLEEAYLTIGEQD